MSDAMNSAMTDAIASVDGVGKVASAGRIACIVSSVSSRSDHLAAIEVRAERATRKRPLH